MKNKVFAVYLALTLALSAMSVSLSWAQTATAPSTAQQGTAEKAKCPCCDKMADGKDAASCARHSMSGSGDKAMTACCAGKDAKSCTQSASACCGDKSGKETCCNEKCAKDCGTGCCSGKNKSEKQA